MTLSRLNAKQQMKSIWRLGGLSVRDLAHSTWNEIIDGEISSQASGLAFNFILAIFPLLMFLVTLFALFASRGTQLSANFFLYLSHVLPLSAFRLVSATIAEIVERASSSRIFFEIITTLWFASGGMSSIISALNSAYLIHDRRSWFKVRGISIVLTIAISVLILSALVLLLIGNAIATFLGSHIPHGSPILTIWHVFQYPLAVFFVVISFALIYYYGPDLEEQHWYWITPGSVLGVILWLAASLGFRVYLHFFNSYGRTYGSLGAAIALLIWLYVSGFAILLGGLINAKIEHAAARGGHPEAKSPGERRAA